MPKFDLNHLGPTARAWLFAMVVALCVALVSLLIEPEVRAADGPRNEQRATQERDTAGAQKPPPMTLQPFRGFGTWVDIYDEKEWDDPEAAVKKMERKGVQTLFLETANYRIKSAMFRPGRVSRFIEKAHNKGIQVVAWYLPDFKNLERDFNRTKAAVRFRSESKQRFDAFALDIESTVVQDIDRRNRRMFRLTRRIRNMNGRGGMKYGAITPDPIGSLYWPNFPYHRVSEKYDLMMPMGYFTFRTSGANGVRNHVEAGIAFLRSKMKYDGRIHYIGGLAGDATFKETRAYRRVAVEKNTMGGGLYDFGTTRRNQWRTLRRLRTLAQR